MYLHATIGLCYSPETLVRNFYPQRIVENSDLFLTWTTPRAFLQFIAPHPHEFLWAATGSGSLFKHQCRILWANYACFRPLVVWLWLLTNYSGLYYTSFLDDSVGKLDQHVRCVELQRFGELLLQSFYTVKQTSSNHPDKLKSAVRLWEEDS